MDTKMAQFSTVWETWSPTAGIQEITGSLWLGVSLSGADLGEGSKYRIWQTLLEQNGLQVINCIVAQLTPVFLTGNWMAAKRLPSSPTHPTWSSSFLWGTKFVWLNIIYSQLGDIFFSAVPRVIHSAKGIKKHGESSRIIWKHFPPGHYLAQIAGILRCLDRSYSCFYDNVNLEAYLTL